MTDKDAFLVLGLAVWTFAMAALGWVLDWGPITHHAILTVVR